MLVDFTPLAGVWCYSLLRFSRQVRRMRLPSCADFIGFPFMRFHNYLSKEGERGRCLKRGGKMEFVPFAVNLADATATGTAVLIAASGDGDSISATTAVRSSGVQ